MSESASTSTVNVYLGGSEDAQGTIKAGSEVLDFKTATKENSAIASGADTLYANTTGKITFKDDTTAFGTDLKLDLSKVNATVEFTSGSANSIDLTKLVVNENASDNITVTTIAGTTSVVGSSAADTIKIGATYTGDVNIDFGGDLAVDLLDISAF